MPVRIFTKYLNKSFHTFLRLCRHKGNKSLASFPATIDGNDKKKGQQFGNGDSQPDSRYSPQDGHQPETEQDEDKTTQQGDGHGRTVAFHTLEIADGYNVDAEAHEAGSKQGKSFDGQVVCRIGTVDKPRGDLSGEQGCNGKYHDTAGDGGQQGQAKGCPYALRISGTEVVAENGLCRLGNGIVYHKMMGKK